MRNCDRELACLVAQPRPGRCVMRFTMNGRPVVFAAPLRRVRRTRNMLSAVLADLFPPEFMRRYTDVKTIDELVAASGYEVESTKDFEAIPDAEWEALIRAKTRFKSWEAMQAKAGEEYIERRLNL